VQALAVALLAASTCVINDAWIDFNRDVAPRLADVSMHCHTLCMHSLLVVTQQRSMHAQQRLKCQFGNLVNVLIHTAEYAQSNPSLPLQS
jgi:hypothetical protein